MQMEHHQNPSQERHVQQPNQGQNQEVRRRTVAAAAVSGGGGGQHNLPHPPAQPCPRCNSNNTKFCYYNNYSLSQPRYFCKGCRRYWTHGGTLRNVPVGGGSRKRKRPKLASPASTAARDPPARFHGQVSGSSNSNGNGNNNHGGVMNIGQSLACGSLLGTPIGTASGGGASAAAFYGGFLPGLSGIPAVNFGSNLGLLHGLGLPSLDHHQGLQQHHQQQQQQHHQQQQQQETVSFQELLHQHHQQNLHPSLIPALQTRDNWILSNTNTTTTTTNNNDNNNNNDDNNNNNNDDPDQWPDFEVGSTGLEDP